MNWMLNDGLCLKLEKVAWDMDQKALGMKEHDEANATVLHSWAANVRDIASSLRAERSANARL